MNLVSYDDSASSSDSSSDDEQNISLRAETVKKTLPLPDLDGLESTVKSSEDAKQNLSASSVFVNPFSKQEEDKLKILSKHVELSEKSETNPKKEDIKYCYQFKRGKCRFGDKCKFVHALRPNTRTKPPEFGVKWEPELIGDLFGTFDNNGDDESEEQLQNRKRRPGLSAGLIPSKKVMTMYNKNKN